MMRLQLHKSMKSIYMCVCVYQSSNFRALWQSYSVHKGRYLINPALVVASDGIKKMEKKWKKNGWKKKKNNKKTLGIMMRQFFKTNFRQLLQGLQECFQNGDIFIVDRGYRDVLPLLENLGIDHKMPALLQPGQLQLDNQAANDSRIITKTRSLVQAHNGHMKFVF